MSSPASLLRRRHEEERRQIHEALVEVCRQRGLGKVTREQVVERAGLGPAAFARHFADLDDCFAQYLAGAYASFAEEARAAVEAEREWRAQLRALVYAMARFLRADEHRAHMLLVETLAAGTLGSLHREQALEALVDLIDRGRRSLDNPTALTRVTAEALAGSLVNQMHQLQVNGELQNVDRIVPQLMYFLVLPYLGREAAAEELSLPPMPHA